MKLRYYLDKGKKIYTLEEKIGNKKTEEAHYKFIKYIDKLETQ
ncbi:MAG: hypothetical protein ACP5NS_02090 [Candidatus Pacearchaeota archaeon]